MPKPSKPGLERAAKDCGLHVATWAPGDGKRRYRFFTRPTDYDAGGGLFTAVGRKTAQAFVRGYCAGVAQTRP